MNKGTFVTIESDNNNANVMISALEVKENALNYALTNLNKNNIIDCFIKSIETGKEILPAV